MTEELEQFASVYRVRPPYGGDSDQSEGMWWPAGMEWVPNTRLKSILIDSARWHARTAILGFVSEQLDDLRQAAISCGTAVELMTKAFLANVSLSLLADKGHTDSLLMLSGNGTRAHCGPTDLRSVLGREALVIAKRIERNLPVDLDELLAYKVRNAAAHMALVDAAELRVAVRRMAQLVDVILGHLDLDREDFWGENCVYVADALVEEATSENARSTEAKVGAARARFARLMQSASPGLSDILLAALVGPPRTSIDHDEPVRCPLCDQPAWLICSVDEVYIPVDIEIDLAYRGPSESSDVLAIAVPSVFECRVCGLELEGAELAHLGFPPDIELSQLPKFAGERTASSDSEPD